MITVYFRFERDSTFLPQIRVCWDDYAFSSVEHDSVVIQPLFNWCSKMIVMKFVHITPSNVQYYWLSETLQLFSAVGSSSTTVPVSGSAASSGTSWLTRLFGVPHFLATLKLMLLSLRAVTGFFFLPLFLFPGMLSNSIPHFVTLRLRLHTLSSLNDALLFALTWKQNSR